MDSELKKERDRVSIRFERDKMMRDDPESHFRTVQSEERIDKQTELQDLIKLYGIAKDANFEEGQELILAKLGAIDLLKKHENKSSGPKK